MRNRGSLLLLLAAIPLAGCEDALLDFTDPDIVLDAQSPAGAIALRNGAIRRFNNTTSGAESLWLFGGLLADEWRSGDTFEQRNTTDQRSVVITNSFLDDQLLDLNRVRFQGTQAIKGLRAYAPTPGSNIGLMFAMIGYSETQMGENYCNGVPFSEVSDEGELLYGDPVSVDSAFKRAVASADSALRYIDGTGGADVANLARIVKGRALLNLNRPAEAATAVAAVGSTFAYKVFHSNNTTTNQIWSLNTGAKRYVVGDIEGINGLPFRTANDPRLPTTAGGVAFDTNTPFISQSVYGQFDAVSVATGVEARLIEAEAALRAGDNVTWLAKLNAARATKTTAPLLPNLADPGNQVARENLTFSERGFWFFGLGHRLGDLRRLIRHYARAPESVFPTGAFGKGGNYGTNYNIPISFDETNNPQVSELYKSTNDTCLNRTP